jgi:hypothetical protein
MRSSSPDARRFRISKSTTPSWIFFVILIPSGRLSAGIYAGQYTMSGAAAGPVSKNG